MAVEDDIFMEQQGGAMLPKALSGSPQANFETAKQDGPLSRNQIEAAQRYAESIGTTFDPRDGYSRTSFLESQTPKIRSTPVSSNIRPSGGIQSSGGINPSGGIRTSGGLGRTIYSTRPPADVRRIMTSGISGPQDQKRLSQFEKSTAGQNFNWGGFQSSLAKLRRDTLGQKEYERQMDMAFREQPPVFNPPMPYSNNLDTDMSEDILEDDFTDVI